MAEDKPAVVKEAPPQPSEAVKDVEEEKTAVVPAPEEKPDDSLAITIVEKIEASDERGAVLAKVMTEKRLSLIDAWEENEKVKAEDRAFKKITSVGAWEIAKMTEAEAEIKKKQEDLEKKKAEYAEELKKRIALIRKEAEEKRAQAEVKRGEDVIKAEKKAAKYRSTGLSPVIERRFFRLLGA
ncbi:remorin-like [Canna indica]|uniref:Remorin-like n=1 Tax=Canna indica TaxID=4628 RepID=A0AAQ3KEW3_9LILI|nr:remorin-like [Canna indica]